MWAIVLLAACQKDQDGSAATAPQSAVPPTQPVASAAAKAPDLGACPKPKLLADLSQEREKPLILPDAAAGLFVADRYRMAVSSLSGATICIDTYGIEGISNAKVSPDKRFISFDWGGFEAFGHSIIDRSGRGQEVDTGTAPLTTADGRRMAAVDLSESGFGSLNAFAVWDIDPTGIKEIARFSEGLPDLGQWTATGWSGDTCVNLEFDGWDEQAGKSRRQPWRAAAGKGWRPEPGSCP
ncbi:MAG TPA: hypothetical protein VFV30_01515 [Novosphingobium sp.]|nr:hypothetical protein [Novosphingobium sp.]